MSREVDTRSMVPRKKQAWTELQQEGFLGKGTLDSLFFNAFPGLPSPDYFVDIGSASICILGSLSSGYTCRKMAESTGPPK